jgi:hypothetical protein
MHEHACSCLDDAYEGIAIPDASCDLRAHLMARMHVVRLAACALVVLLSHECVAPRLAPLSPSLNHTLAESSSEMAAPLPTRFQPASDARQNKVLFQLYHNQSCQARSTATYNPALM